MGKQRNPKNLLLKGREDNETQEQVEGIYIENETERGLEDENDDRDQTTRAMKMMRDPFPRTTETTREPKRRLSDTAKT